MEDRLNNTRQVSDTSNPQNAGETSGPSNGADFQSTAPQDVLRQEQQQSLTVQETGEPLPAGSNTSVVDGGLSVMWWAVIIIASVAVGSVLAIKLWGDSDESYTPAEPAKPARAKSTATKKKVTKTKSGKPAKSRKKTTKQRR